MPLQDPMQVVAAVGDPMQVVVAGMTIAASRYGGVFTGWGNANVGSLCFNSSYC